MINNLLGTRVLAHKIPALIKLTFQYGRYTQNWMNNHILVNRIVIHVMKKTKGRKIHNTFYSG